MGQPEKNVPCFLVLEDGTVLPGESFGAKKPVEGEVGKLNEFVSVNNINTCSDIEVRCSIIHLFFVLRSTE